jgi:rhodanese-related sulfurtransferase
MFRTKKYGVFAGWSIVSLLCAIAFLVSCATTSVKADARKFQNVDADEALELIQKNKENENFVILDIRTPAEYEAGHIKNAVNIDFYSETFRKDLDKLDKSRTYLMHCRSGNRSSRALEIFKDLGYKNIYHLHRGIVSWQAEGYPLVQ